MARAIPPAFQVARMLERVFPDRRWHLFVPYAAQSIVALSRQRLLYQLPLRLDRQRSYELLVGRQIAILKWLCDPPPDKIRDCTI